jgi:8-oxo-dGTP pyrophosphatase MutT (NUDIX family)
VAPFARLPVPIRRRLYRLAYALLCVYWFIRRPSAHGVKCVLTDGGRVLLVVHTYGEAVWELPGGAIRSGEAPLHAAQREMEEELGIEFADWRSLGEVAGRAQHRHDTLHCFHAEVHEPALRLDLGELEVARWFAFGELPPHLGRYVDPILARLASAADAS